MARTFAQSSALLLLLAAAAPAALAQDGHAGTYTLRGEDSLGNAIRGVLRIDADGRFEREVQVGEATHRLTGAASRSGSPGQVVLTWREAPPVGMSGVLAGRGGGDSEQLTITWTASDGTVRVQYVRGDYGSIETGTRAASTYDLRRLRDEPGPVAEILYRVTAEQRQPGSADYAPLHTEALRYLRRGDASEETRTYAQLSVNGEEAIQEETVQRLSRRGSAWQPEPGRVTRNLQATKSMLVPQTYSPLKITDLMPAEPVAVGAEWELSSALMVRFLNLPVPPRSGGVRGKLLRVDTVDGGLRYEIAFSISLELVQGASSGTLRGQMRVRQGPAQHVVVAKLRYQATTPNGEVDQRTVSSYSVGDRPTR